MVPVAARAPRAIEEKRILKDWIVVVGMDPKEWLDDCCRESDWNRRKKSDASILCGAGSG